MTLVIWILLFLPSSWPLNDFDGAYWQPVSAGDSGLFHLIATPSNITSVSGDTRYLTLSTDMIEWRSIQLSDTECHSHNLFSANESMWDLCVRPDFKTRVLRTHDFHSWSSPLPEFPVPVRQKAILNDSTLLLAGDSGILALLSPGGTRLLDSPSPHHITSLTTYDDNIYIGYRNDGVYRLDQSDLSWSSMPFRDETKLDITMAGRLKNNTIIALRSDGRLFKWEDGYFRPFVQKLPDDIIRMQSAYLHHGLLYMIGRNYLWIFDGDQMNHVTLPTSARISGVFTGPEETPYIQNINGRLWRLDSGLDFGLVEAPALLDLSFMPSAKNVRYVRTRLSNSEEPEHIFWDSEKQNQIKIFQFDKANRLRDVTSSLLPDPISRIDQLYVSDLTNDGKSELMTVRQQPDATHFSQYLNVYGKLKLRHSWNIPVDDYSRLPHAETLDMDGDGYSDLLLSFYYSRGTREGAVIWLKNRRKGRFEPSEPRTIPHTAGWNSIFRLADFNANGAMDLLLGNYWRSDRLIYDINDAGTGDNKIFDFPEKTNTHDLLVADFTADGTRDMIRVTLEYGLELWVNNHPQPGFTRKMVPAFLNYSHNEIQAMIATDLNGNGRNDLILSLDNGDSADRHVLLNLETGFEDASGRIFTDNYSHGTWTVWDYNKDERPDIMVIHPARTTILKNIGTPTDQPLSDTLSTTGKSTIKSSIFTDNRHIFITGGHDLPKIRSLINRCTAQLDYIRRKKWFYQYLLMIIASYSIIFIGLRTGVKNFDWRFDLTTLLFMINSIFFWMLLFLLMSHSGILRLFVPMGAATGGTFLPLFLSYRSRQVLTFRDRHHLQHELLEVLLRFSHGAWANSITNRLIMLMKNYQPEENPELLKQIHERMEHFHSSLLPELKRMIELTRHTGTSYELTEQLQAGYDYFQKLTTDQILSDIHIAIRNLELLKEAISRLRHAQWKLFSSNIIDAIREVTDSYQNQLTDKGITLTRTIGSEPPFIALVPHPTLTQVLDNLLANAIKALHKQKKPEIRLHVTRKAPKIYITLHDNGIGLDPAVQARVFETGFSTFGSSGLGMSSARKELARYGARISIDNADDGPGTIVTLEFMEGTE